MKPAAFDYVKPASVADAVAALGAHEATILAGGQSLVPLMNLRLARPSLLVDVNGLFELDYVRSDSDHITVGALCRHRRLEFDPVVAEQVPLLAEAASLIGYPAIRNRGTLGGSVAHADPAAELGAALLALGATVSVVGPRGPRRIEADDLFSGFFTTSLATDELLVEVTVPSKQPGEGSAFVEFAPRRGDFAVVGIAARLTRDRAGKCSSVTVAGCGLATTPVNLSNATDTLIGEKSLDDDHLRSIAARIGTAFEPTSDLQASGADRRELASAVTVEALRRAWVHAGGGL